MLDAALLIRLGYPALVVVLGYWLWPDGFWISAGDHSSAVMAMAIECDCPDGVVVGYSGFNRARRHESETCAMDLGAEGHAFCNCRFLAWKHGSCMG